MFTVCYAAYGCFIACISLMKVANYIIYKQDKLREKMNRKLIKRATKIKKGVVKRAGLKRESKELEKRRNSPSERVARWIWCNFFSGSLEDNRSIANVSVPRDRHSDADVVVWRQVRLFVKVIAQLTQCFAIIFGGLALGHIEEWNNLDCVYWAFITVFSVGVSRDRLSWLRRADLFVALSSTGISARNRKGVDYSRFSTFLLAWVCCCRPLPRSWRCDSTTSSSRSKMSPPFCGKIWTEMERLPRQNSSFSC